MTSHDMQQQARERYRANKHELTQGDPDGPMAFVPSLGQEVPTFIDPRMDLIPDKRTAAVFKRLSYHIPFHQRGVYKPEWLPHDFAEHMGEAGEIRLNFEGFVLCSAISKGTDKECGNLAVNRANVCRNHGGALHPADKKMSQDSVMVSDPARIAVLDRPQQYVQGFLKMEDLTDDEITGGYVLNNDGRPVASVKLGAKFQQQMVKELHRRMNQFMQMKLPTMLKRMADFAESDIVEPEVAFKAMTWLAERQMGKTPEVLIHAQTGAPYESILDSLESGSREDYRKSITSERGEGRELPSGGSGTPGVYSEDGEILDIFEVDDGEADPEYVGFLSGEKGASDGRPRNDGVGPNHGNDQPDNSDDAPGDYASRADEIERKAERAKEIIAARKKAQRRRFAARAQGASAMTEMFWLPLFKRNRVMRDGRMVDEGWRVLLVCPEDQNERMLARIEASAVSNDARG